MSLLGRLLGATVGFATGNPIAGAASLFSGGDSPAREVTQPQLGQRTSASQMRMQLAYLRGLRQALGQAQAYSAQQAMQQGQQGGGDMFGQNRMANQRGGSISVPNQPGARPLATDRGGGSSVTPTTYNSPMQNSYESAMQRALSGNDYLPQGIYANAVARGQGAINQQAMAGRSALLQNMARRGILNSGITGQGMVGLEQSRLGALQNFYGGLEEQNLAAARSSQQQFNRSQPGIFDYLGTLAGALAQQRALGNIKL